MSRSTVLVVGGGPAGATAAALLARSGIDVALFDRARFPRYHIGESIVPACKPILELIGLRNQVEEYGFVAKEGVYFRWGDKRWDYRFGSLTGDYTSAWQVERADFDELLLRHAQRLGVRVHEGRRVTELRFGADGAPVAADWAEPDTGRTGQHEFGYLIDASGRAGLMANKYLSGRQFHESFKNVAFWAYWEGGRPIPEAPPGATLVESTDHGWIWGIPLRHGTTSVGVVMHKTHFQALRAAQPIDGIYRDTLRRSDMIGRVLHDARQAGEIRLEQDYSYAAQQFAGPRYFMAGDAACFLDPLLSTGVHLAMLSALLAAACVCSLCRGEISPAAAQEFYEESYRRTYLRFLVIVSAVYKQHLPTDSYFWEAQRLTVRDIDPGRAFDAFLNVVSGVEDLADARGQDLADGVVERVSSLYWDVHKNLQEKLRQPHLTEEDREQIAATAGYWKSIIGTHTIDRQHAVSGRFVVTEPELGVASVEKAAAAAVPG